MDSSNTRAYGAKKADTKYKKSSDLLPPEMYQQVMIDLKEHLNFFGYFINENSEHPFQRHPYPDEIAFKMKWGYQLKSQYCGYKEANARNLKWNASLSEQDKKNHEFYVKGGWIPDFMQPKRRVEIVDPYIPSPSQ